MDDIYQQIWNADMAGNGVVALRPGEPKDAAAGHVVVDERATAVGPAHRVLSEVVIPEAKRETYRLCEALFDNYALERAAREVIRAQERQEEMDLIDAILGTPPVQLARQHIEAMEGLTVSDAMLAALLRETWFTIGRSGSQLEASGFEHVFVGEQGSSRSEIGGYHFWYKYHLDDGGHSAALAGTAGVDRLEYHGTRYAGAAVPEQGILVPEVVTLSLVWDAPGGDGGAPRRLVKPIGGFFVGLSPEGLMAMGLVRSRTPSGKRARINGAEYTLDLHRLDGAPNAIRTFFPRFERADVTAIEEGPAPAIEGGPAAAGVFRIIAAMVNPVNPEGGREFVQILNVGAEVASLGGWRLVAPNGTSFTLAAQGVAPGEVFRFVIPSAGGVLRNSAGDIRLVAPDGRLTQVASYSSEDARREGVPVVF